jgi:hypothetical protein
MQVNDTKEAQLKNVCISIHIPGWRNGHVSRYCDNVEMLLEQTIAVARHTASFYESERVK